MPQKPTHRELQARIAELEAIAEAAAKEQKKADVARVHALMRELKLTMADLLAGSSKVAKELVELQIAPVGKTKANHSPAPPESWNQPIIANAPPRVQGPPKYRNPDTGETWDGKFRAPKWINYWEAKGFSRDLFLIGTKS